MLKNTDRVRQSAITFMDKGYYTSALPGTKDYYDFWDEEKKRCLYGYTVDEGTEDELCVTGFHYFYLNYCPIDRAVDETLPDGGNTIQHYADVALEYEGEYTILPVYSVFE